MINFSSLERLNIFNRLQAVDKKEVLSSIGTAIHCTIENLGNKFSSDKRLEGERFGSTPGVRSNSSKVFLDKEQAESCVLFASLSCAAVQTDKSWGEALGWTLVPPSKFSINFSHISGDLQCLDNCFFDPSTGFKVLVFQKGQDYVLSFGSMRSSSNPENSVVDKVLLNCSEYRQCAGNLLGQKPQAFAQAEQFTQQFNRIANENHHKVTLTGMHFGASLASYAALKNSTYAVCFDSFPLGPRLQDDIGADRLSKSSQHICHIKTNGNFVSNSILDMGKMVSRINGRNQPQLFGKQYYLPTAYSGRKETHQFVFRSLIHFLGYDFCTRPNELKDDLRERCSGVRDFHKLLEKNSENIASLYFDKPLTQCFSILPGYLTKALQSLQYSPYNIEGQFSKSLNYLKNVSIALHQLDYEIEDYTEKNKFKNEAVSLQQTLLGIYRDNLSILETANKGMESCEVWKFSNVWHEINDLMGEIMQKAGAIENSAYYHSFDSCDFSGKGECQDLSKISLLEGKKIDDYLIDKSITTLRTLSSQEKIPSKPKIHIFYIRSGWGHVMATRAIAQYLPDCSIKSVYFGDFLEFGNLKKDGINICDKAFNFLMKNEQTGLLNEMQRHGSIINEMLLSSVTKKLYNHIERERPDVLISTHPLFNSAYIEAARQFQLPLLIVSTDMGLEDFNLFIDDKHTDPNYQNYGITATYSEEEHEKHLGENATALADKIEYNFGYPTRSTFFTNPSEEEMNMIRKEFGVQPNETVVLITLGGNAGFSNETCSEFLSSLSKEQINEMLGNNQSRALRVICLCGDSKDPAVKKIIDHINSLSSEHVRFTAVGRTEKMSSLMSLPELKLIIAKAGGSTSREMETKGKAAIYLTNGTPLNWELPNIEYGESKAIARRFNLVNKSQLTRNAFLKAVQESMNATCESNKTVIRQVNFSKSLRHWIREALDRTEKTHYSEFPCDNALKNVVNVFKKAKQIAPELPWKEITKNLRVASPLGSVATSLWEDAGL